MKKRLKLHRLIYLGVSGYIAFVLIHQQILIHSIKVEQISRMDQITKLKSKNEMLKGQEKTYESNPDLYYEKLAREKLGLVKQDETPIVNSPEKDAEK
ncbi:MAG TPA: septum formation initiator family protein [Clostridiaceae bacterium]